MDHAVKTILVNHNRLMGRNPKLIKNLLQETFARRLAAEGGSGSVHFAL